MSDGPRPLPTLRGEQARASRPDAHVWLSASAGTGKTQVLAARVFRLLLHGTSPGAILALTFTKAGAAEMAARINRQLAAWVRMDETALQRDLVALGERGGPEQRARARTLFADVLDAPGGGIRIQTIHGFCQSLLAAFPVEAGMTPGFRTLEPREEALLRRETLVQLLVDADAEGRSGPVATIGALSLRLGERGAEGFLAACARAGDALDALPSGIVPFVRRALDVPTGDIDEAIGAGCRALDVAAIRRLGAANRAWGAATGLKQAEVVEAWLAADDLTRVATLAELAAVVRTKDGSLRKASAKLAAAEADYEAIAADLGDRCAELLSLRVRAGYADLLGAALEVGRDYARAYSLARRRAGAVDFDDLIAATVRLLTQPGIGEWIRYKLDRVTEHVLVDEAQDTNVAQWTIIRALVEEFFTGRGVFAPSTRTLFTVGDQKQAIFGFQGTDPVNFAAAERYFAEKAAQVIGDDSMADDERGLAFDRLSLVESFRSTAPVLAFVDEAIAVLGADALGGEDAIPPHASRVAGPGEVLLLPPVTAGSQEAAEEGGEEGWLDDEVRENATRIARQVRAWLGLGGGEPLWLGSKGRALRPEDVMILVQRRGDLARLLVARLYAEGVPVAGVDRLRLDAPLAVQDLLAAIRFVLQPQDDLSLASLLVSPLIGWTQEELLARAIPRSGSLWAHLSGTDALGVAALQAMLTRADFTTPYQFFEEILSGAAEGRRKLLARLGEEARDPIEELLSAALDFETQGTPSLQRFLDWFERDAVEIKRDAEQAIDAVRVMTAHGAKGLQAPLVILADATGDPDASRGGTLLWRPDGMTHDVPVFAPRKEERAGAIDAALAELERRERAEHWRLFYVAATRAEERLVLTGSLGARAKGVPPDGSWYALAQRTFDALGVAADGERRYAGGDVDRATPMPQRAAAAEPAAALPGWARAAAPVEARPPRPLAPSRIGEDEVADPPPTPAMRAAAERGRLMHALFERLPAVSPGQRMAAALGWLRAQGAAEGEAVAERVCAVMTAPDLAALFAPEALAEAPISAVLPDGRVIAGTVDRLLVEPGRVRVIDYKTGRNVPEDARDVPPYHLRQMAAYRAALQVIFPAATVEAALLYTAGPRLIALDGTALDDIVASTKPGLATAEQS